MAKARVSEMWLQSAQLAGTPDDRTGLIDGEDAAEFRRRAGFSSEAGAGIAPEDRTGATP